MERVEHFSNKIVKNDITVNVNTEFELEKSLLNKSSNQYFICHIYTIPTDLL